MCEIDLADLATRSVAEPAPPPPAGTGASAYGRARVLVRLQGEPLGLIEADLPGGELDLGAVVAEARWRFAPALRLQLGPGWARLLSEPLPPVSSELARLAAGPLPGVSVVIGTRNRAEHAVACVAAVLKQAYAGPFEVIVVDNGSDSDATAEAVAAEIGPDERVRFLSERRPGLSRARNIGLNAARHPIVAFLSDDIRVDPLWMLALVRGFRRANDVRCVVGYCPPLHLDTEAQLTFEQRLGWGWRNGFEPRVVGGAGADAADRLHPYRVGIGIGANMAFDTAWFRSVGGFDQALGPGTLARGGEDLDAPVRVLLAGQRCTYEPAALGWHADRYDDRTFGAHMFTYGVGLTAFVASHLADPATRPEVARRVPLGLGHLFRADRLPPAPGPLVAGPVRLRYRAANVAGRLAGPALYLRSRRALRRVPPVPVTPPPAATAEPQVDPPAGRHLNPQADSPFPREEQGAR